MRWGHTTLWRGAPTETFREGYIPPLRLSKKVCLPLGPLCEGAPPAGGGGENCAVARNISGYGKVLSLAEGVFSTLLYTAMFLLFLLC